MDKPVPFVRVVVLAFDGAGMTLECLRSILDSDWPMDRLEIVLVDNGSLDDSVELVRTELPRVRLVEPMRNLGFAGGCNLGISSNRCSRGEPLQPFDFVALVNNDATVEANWLKELVAPFDKGSDIGAVCPKILFASRFSEIAISGLLTDSPSGSDAVVRVTAVRIDGHRLDDRLAFDEGFTELGPHAFKDDELGQGTRFGGRLRIERDENGEQSRHVVSVRLECDRPGRVRIGSDLESLEIDLEARGGHRSASWVDIAIGSDVFDVVNNAGSELYVNGSAGDRGFLHRDSGQFDHPAEVFAWCGGAVLLSREYLADVGVFDDSFFLYYEDTDLAWRGRLRGWRYLYAPQAIVRHLHAQSSVAGSDLFRFQVERNRLLVLTKNAPARVAVSAVLGEVRRFVDTAVADVIVRVLRLSPPRLRDVVLRKRVLVSYATLLPAALRNRWALDVRKSRRRVMRWAVEKRIPVPTFGDTRVIAPTDHLEASGISKAVASHSAGRPRAAVYNLYWDTLGGGEVVSGEVAKVLTERYAVTLLGPSQPDAATFADRLGIDISGCTWQEVGDDDEASQASADFDVFVNCTYSSRAVNRAPIGLYYVHFPRALVPRSKQIALETGIKIVHLAERTPVRKGKLETAERVFHEQLGDDSWVHSYSNFLANSRYTQTWIGNIWGCPSEVLYPPVRSRVNGTAKSHLIASVGRFFDPKFGHSKKQLEMLTAFADMCRSWDGVGDWRMSLVGGADGPSRDFVLRIRRAAVGLPIDVHVNAPRHLVEQTLAQASIYWHASGYGEDEQHHPERFEHFGISVVEAMAAGAVPLVFAAAGPVEIVRDGVDGFHWHTLEQLARQTRRLMGDAKLLKSMSDSAKVRARDFEPVVFEDRLKGILAAQSTAPQAM